MDKHELHDDSEQQSEQTEWDSLTDTAPFSKESEESPDETIEFVTDKYSGILDKMIGNMYFDGTDRSDPHHYTVSIIFNDYLSPEEQYSIVDSCAKGESITPEITQKILGGIADIIKKNGLTKTFKSDPFLRDRRLTNLTKSSRLVADEDEPWEVGSLIRGLWSVDDDFYKDVGMPLLYNRDYLDRRCNVYSKAESYAASFPGDAAQAKEQFLTNLSKTMEHLINIGQVSAKEIIEDPLLRKRHFDNLPNLAISPSKIDPTMYSLWELDSDFRDSDEYKEAFYSKINSSPEIYNPEDAEVDRVIDETLEKIPKKRLAEIARVYERNPRKGDRLLLNLLAPHLGLEGNLPNFGYYAPENDRTNGDYAKEKHLIGIYEETINSNFPDDESSRQSVFSLFKSKEPRNSTYKRMGVVTHEAWHAHQWAGTNIEENRKRKYQENFFCYIRATTSYSRYRKQLIEKEAFQFGDKIEARIREAVKERNGK